MASGENSVSDLRVTAFSAQGLRHHMEDRVALAYAPMKENGDSVYAYMGVFDGHGGSEAAQYAKDNLMRLIINQPGFRDEDDASVLNAIRQGFISLHNDMLDIRASWQKTSTGYLSTAGTTASIAFIRNGKVYTGHVGDSRIVLGAQESLTPDAGEPWVVCDLTKDHKPEDKEEKVRIEAAGGKVMIRSGVSRIAWKRPLSSHNNGPIRRSTPMEEIPFLSVARSLGDFWSYNPDRNKYVVSPDPDLNVLTLDPMIHRCLILASDGVWGVLTSEEAMRCVQRAELQRINMQEQLDAIENGADPNEHGLQNLPSSAINPSASLVNLAMKKWLALRLRSDNTSVVTVMIDYPHAANVHAAESMNFTCGNEEVVIIENSAEDDDDDDISTDEISSSDGESGGSISDTIVETPPRPGNKGKRRSKNYKIQSLSVQSQVVSSSSSASARGLGNLSPVTPPVARKRGRSSIDAPSSLALHKDQSEFPLPPKMLAIGRTGTDLKTSSGRSNFEGTTEGVLARPKRKLIPSTRLRESLGYSDDSPFGLRVGKRNLESRISHSQRQNHALIEKVQSQSCGSPSRCISPFVPLESLGRTSVRPECLTRKTLNEHQTTKKNSDDRGSQRRHTLLPTSTPETRLSTLHKQRITRSLSKRIKRYV